ncbi:hypothetical protein UA08_07557 [Talaromyces atroroseus]|uniref:Nephrocystin 3-like N-terminal domain-containing protein n=1 Tax=Talaromyces atroroseus TaxID=1441469 RepID=A0A225AUF2_TALAT|nr:hypothetical protein UA08_07557 [Talaromyces atroroseus]OKL57097.1 hypothetical protein UA08_07557 [Talaromyces atroroseus]
MPKFLKIFKKKKSRIPASLPEKTAEPVKPIENVKKVEESSHSKVQPEQTAETVKPAENIANVKKVEEPSNSEGGTEQTGAIIEKSKNAAFQEAWKQHWNDLSENERKAWSFQDVRSSLQVHQAIEDIDKLHREQSVARRIADRTLSFLQVVESLMAGATIGIQAYPEVSSIVFGVIRLVIDDKAAVKYFEYYEKLTKMMEDIADLLKALRAFAEIKFWFQCIQIYSPSADMRAELTLIKIRGKEADANALAVFARVQWAPFEAQFGKIQSNLKRQTENLNIVSNAIIIKSTSALEENMLKRDSLNARKERQEFLEWLSMDNIVQIHDVMSNKRYKDTGSWLLETEAFNNWIKSRSSNIFWLFGPAKLELANPYFREETNRQLMPVQMMSNLVKQLCWELKELPDSVIKLYREFATNARHFTFDDLRYLFLQCSMLFRRVFVVLDGLDECDEKFRKPILKFCCEIDDQVHNVKIFLASREEIDISSKIRRLDAFWLGSKNNSAQKDIERFVKYRVATELGHINPKLREEVTKTLIENSNGMYLWVDLQLNDLLLVAEPDIRTQLKMLPTDLENTYLSMFRRMITSYPQTTKSLIQMCFLWGLYTKETIDNETLVDAVSLKYKMAGEDKNPYDGFMLNKLTNGLLQLNRFGMDDVRPIHFSLKEFATNPRTEHPPELHEVLLNNDAANAKMAIMCLQHLLAEVEPLDMIWGTCLGYCGRHFDSHIQSITTVPEELWNMLDYIFIKEPAKMKRILSFRYPSHVINFPNWTCLGDPVLDPTMFMRLTSLHKMPSIWSRYKDADETKRDYSKDYIYLAAAVGLEEILRNIIAQGVNVNKATRDGLTALQLALDLGSEDPRDSLSCAEILLDAGADWNFVNKMSSKIYTNLTDAEDHTPLNYAIFAGRHLAVQLVIGHKTFNFANYMKTIPKKRHEEYIKYLVEQAGVDINQRDEYGDTALTVAKEDGREDCVKILEDLGAVE